MSGILTGQTLQLYSTGKAVRVGNVLGRGTQGTVYRATVDGTEYALKWYEGFPEPRAKFSDYQRRCLDRIINQPAPSKKFTWPHDIVISPDLEDFGYLMDLKPEGFTSITRVLTRDIEPTFAAIARAGFYLSNAFRRLHMQGLCYRDINAENIEIHEKTGDILIFDNDNVTINGDPEATIAGTPKFMAPEIVRGQALPSTETDLHSLAVLLFYILMLSHPLEGKNEHDIVIMDMSALKSIYGDNPVFIFDPVNNSNRPVKGVHDNAHIFWPIYPLFLRERFIQAFTEGLKDPHKRVVEGVWRKDMLRLLDSIILCPDCHAENFYDRDTIKQGQKQPVCWNCKRTIPLPARIRIDNDIIVMMNDHSELYAYHIQPSHPYDISKPLATVSQHPTKAHIKGLTNLSDANWVCTTPEGENIVVERGKNIRLRDGMQIDFGGVQGVVRLPET